MATNRTETQMDSGGMLIVLEGPDGVGKTTLAKCLVNALRCRGLNAAYESFPGRATGTLGRIVYQLHHDPSSFGIGEPTPLALQTLHVAAHVEAIACRLLPALKGGQTIVLDRFWWSTYVYGASSNAPEAAMQALLAVEREAWEGRLADQVFLLACAEPRERQVDLAAWMHLAQHYAALAERESTSYRVAMVENLGSPEAATAKMLRVLAETMPSRSCQRRTGRTTSAHTTQLPLQLGALQEHTAHLAERAATPAPVAPLVYQRAPLAPAVPSRVYPTYWHFAAERQRVFFRRLRGDPPPWTSDPIIGRFKFTNAYRAADRVSQYLIRHVIYREDLPQSPDEICFRVLLFKLFNRVDTWTLLERDLGRLTWADYSFSSYDEILTRAMRSNQRIYSAAYIMPPATSIHGASLKHRNHLKLLEVMVESDLATRLQQCRHMQDAFSLLLEFPSIGEFLAYQFITDINYSTVTNFSEMDFVVPGPGARDGLRKCFTDLGGLNEPEVIKYLTDHQTEECARLGITLPGLWGRPLQLIDCQNLFCEVDKYSRVAHPEVRGRAGRTRIKQRFTPTSPPLEVWFPPKWGINGRLSQLPSLTDVPPVGDGT